MFKWMVIGGLGVVCAIFMVSNTTILKKKERANHVLYETLTTNYIVQRLGVTHVRVMAHITMAPTKNVRVIEALTPQTVTTKRTLIGTKQGERPLPPPSRSVAPHLALPGMAPFQGVSAASVTPNTVSVTREKNDHREQVLTEHVFYNKDTQTASFYDQIVAVHLAVFLPQPWVTNAYQAQLTQELNQLLNTVGQFQLSLTLNPIQTSPGLVALFRSYDQLFNAMARHPVWVMIGVLLMILIGTIIQYIRFKMTLATRSNHKTVVVKEATPSPKASREGPRHAGGARSTNLPVPTPFKDRPSFDVSEAMPGLPAAILNDPPEVLAYYLMTWPRETSRALNQMISGDLKVAVFRALEQIQPSALSTPYIDDFFTFLKSPANNEDSTVHSTVKHRIMEQWEWPDQAGPSMVLRSDFLVPKTDIGLFSIPDQQRILTELTTQKALVPFLATLTEDERLVILAPVSKRQQAILLASVNTYSVGDAWLDRNRVIDIIRTLQANGTIDASIKNGGDND
jgi:flagellar biosynthesis protein FliQ